MAPVDSTQSPIGNEARDAQRRNEETILSLRRAIRNIKILILFLACAVFAALIGYAVWLTGRSNGIIEGAAKTKIVAIAPGPGDIQKEIDAAVQEAMERDESLLDKILLLVGVYSTILSFLALGTVVVNRQDAKEQLQRLRDDTRDFANENEKQLQKVRADAGGFVSENKALFEALSKKIHSEFPFISQSQSHVLGVIRELEAKYPEDENSAKKQNSTWETEVHQQDALLDELLIVAVSAILLGQDNLLKLYLVLARFYLARFQTGRQTDNDAARAFVYTSRAIAVTPENAETWRLRGVIALLRYQKADRDRKSKNLGKDSTEFAEFVALLRSAKTDLMECMKKDPRELGAYFNLAIAHDEEGNRRDAIRLSEAALTQLANFPRAGLEKYLSEVSVNLACYFAYDLHDENELPGNGDPLKKDELCEKIVAACTKCRDYLRDKLQSSKAKDEFIAGMRRELAPEGDFRGLPPETRAKLEGLLDWRKEEPKQPEHRSTAE